MEVAAAGYGDEVITGTARFGRVAHRDVVGELVEAGDGQNMAGRRRDGGGRTEMMAMETASRRPCLNRRPGRMKATVADPMDVLPSDGDDGGHGTAGEYAGTAPNRSAKLRQ